MILKYFLFLSIFSIIKSETEDIANKDKKENENLDDVKISEIESWGFVNYTEDYLMKKNKNSLNKEEFVDLILNLYVNSDLDQIAAVEQKIKLNQTPTTEEEHNLNFKNHIEDFLDFHDIAEIYDRERIIDIIKNNKILIYLENLSDVRKTNFFDFPDHDEEITDEELKRYDSTYNEEVENL